MKKFVTLLLLALLAALPVGAQPSSDAAPPGMPAADAWPTVPLPALELDAPGDAPASLPQLDDALATLAAQPLERAAVAAPPLGLHLEDGRVQARLVVAPGGEAAARAAVVAAGGRVTGALGDALQVWLPPAALVDVATASGVVHVGVPDYVQLADVTSEGVARAEAPSWHAAGLRGQGVRIAIIDAGFQGYNARLGSELPASVVVKNFVDGQPDSEVDATTAHGTACAEIVHDMAPAADLYLLKISTDVDLDQAVTYAISQGVDVISTSLTFLNVTPGDGTGKFAAMAARARAAGVLWVTAAGNYREQHWSGQWADADGDGLHEYAPGAEVNVFGPGNNTAYQIPSGYSLTVSIRWDDWGEVRQDFRLLLLRYNGSRFDIVASANSAQTGQPGQRPTERISYLTSGSSAVYGIAVQRISGNRPVYLHLLTPNRDLDRRVTAMSLGDLADVPDVLTVGAVGTGNPFAAADYSSEGPTTGPGGAPVGGRLKPNVSAYAGVSTASYGTRAFGGTSAATPHVTGAVAVARSQRPGFGPAALQFYLEEMSVDLGPACADTRYGYGRLLLRLPGEPARNQLFLPLMARNAERC